jgi:HEAT repeat protein
MRATLIGAALVSLSLFVLDAGRLEAQIPKKEDVPKNLNLLKTSKSPSDRAHAAEQLGLRGQLRASDVKEAIEPLLDAVKSDDSAQVRKAAATAIGRITPDAEKAVPVLTEALKDKSTEVRMAAATALGAFRAEARSALSALRELASEKTNKKLSNAARQAIKAISAR